MERRCPDCGSYLDPCEICDCHKKENAPAATEAPSSDKLVITSSSLSNSHIDVNHCLMLRELHKQTGAMGKEIALVVRDVFPKFNRQLLAQCESPDKYGVIIHPAAIETICKAYGVTLRLEEPPVEVTDEPIKVKKQEKRKLPHKLTVRMTESDFKRLQRRLQADGYESVQAWIYDTVIKALEVEK